MFPPPPFPLPRPPQDERRVDRVKCEVDAERYAVGFRTAASAAPSAGTAVKVGVSAYRARFLLERARARKSARPEDAAPDAAGEAASEAEEELAFFSAQLAAGRKVRAETVLEGKLGGLSSQASLDRTNADVALSIAEVAW